ncbi:MAG: hypothetical protein ACR2QW_00445 [bacterium]
MEKSLQNLIIAGFLLLMGPAALAQDHGVAIPSNISFSAIPVCYDFGCATKAVVKLPVEEWQSVVGWFDPPAQTPAEERDQIRRAVGWMEVLIGRHTPTHLDLEFDKVNNIDNRETGQLDCIDESVNTTIYMKLFEANGFFKHHIVIEEAYRRSAFDQHWAGQIKEIETGDRYVVDSWFQPNGYLPVVQDSPSWEDITMLSAVVDNRPDEDGEQVKRSFWYRLLRGE